MQTLRTKITIRNVASMAGTFILTALFAWWGMHFPGLSAPSARADTFPISCAAMPTPTPITDGTPLPSLTCSPTPTPYPTSDPPQGLEILPTEYQNPNRAVMAWIQYGGDYSTKKPGVILIHPHSFDAGTPDDVLEKIEDLANAGFFAASAYYELAPNDTTISGYIVGQPCHDNDGTDAGWRMTLEINDIKNAIKAMRADARCNGWVAVLGGSAGATHAITVALDTNPTPGGAWPHWFESRDDRPDCAVMLSAIYDFGDWTPPTGQTQTDPVFVHYALNNYAQTLDHHAAATLALNPVNLVDGAVAHGWKPVYMFNSYYDHPTAYHQLDGMICRLQSKGLTLGTDYQYLTVPGDDHAFEYWGGWDHNSTSPKRSVEDDVIAFLKAQAGLP
jgi:hypothetical protein